MEERKKQLYKKETWITVIFVLLIMLMGHTATLFVVFPGWQGGNFWGFPRHYIIPILTGWFGLGIVCYAMLVVCNRFDDELEELVTDGQVPKGTSASQKVAQVGSTVEGGK